MFKLLSYNLGAARLRRAATLRVRRSPHTFSRFAAFGTALRAALRIASPYTFITYQLIYLLAARESDGSGRAEAKVAKLLKRGAGADSATTRGTRGGSPKNLYLFIATNFKQKKRP
jgi:hypothetical protein